MTPSPSPSVCYLCVDNEVQIPIGNTAGDSIVVTDPTGNTVGGVNVGGDTQSLLPVGSSLDISSSLVGMFLFLCYSLFVGSLTLLIGTNASDQTTSSHVAMNSQAIISVTLFHRAAKKSRS